MLHPLEIEIQKLEEKKQALEVDIFNHENTIKKLEREIDSVQKELENFQSAGKEAHTQLQKVSDRVTQEIASLELQLSNKKTELAAFQATVTENEKIAFDIENQTQSAQNLFEQSKKQLQADIDSTIEAREKVIEIVNSLVAKKEELEYNIQTLQQSIEANKAKAVEIETVITEKEKKVAEVSEQYNLVVSLVEKEKYNVAILKKQSTENIALIDAQKAEITKLSSEIITLTQQRNDKEKDLLAIGIREKNVNEKEKTLKEYYQRAGVEYPQS